MVVDGDNFRKVDRDVCEACPVQPKLLKLAMKPGWAHRYNKAQSVTKKSSECSGACDWVIPKMFRGYSLELVAVFPATSGTKKKLC